MLTVESVSLADEELVAMGQSWIGQGQQVFPLASFTYDGLGATWQRCVDYPGDHLLVARDERGAVAGLTGLLIDNEESRFLGGPVGHDVNAAADAFLGWFQGRYTGVAVGGGIGANNTAARRWWSRHGELRETSTVFARDVIVGPAMGLLPEPVIPTPDSLAHELHRAALPDGWWTAERVAADAENWICLADPEGRGYLAARLDRSPTRTPEAEVFAATGETSVLSQLLRHLGGHLQLRGISRLIFFADSMQIQAAAQADLDNVATYEDWLIRPS